MAAAISPFFPFGVLSLCFLLALCNHANSISFDFVFNTTQTFSDAYLQRSGDAFFPTSEMIELTKNDRTGYINNSMGLVWYAQPVPLWSNATGELASFTTAFSFEIKIDDQSSTYEPGDGMTFFLTHYPPAPRNQTSSGGGDLGLFMYGTNNLTGDFRAVAVEFDTYHNIQWNESQSQHIGIDINSIESVASTDTISPAVLVPSNSTSTVNYNSSTKLLAVDVRINGTLYHVNFTVDLREVLPEEVAVGFSASNGFSAEFHRVKNWSFSSTDLQQLQKTPARPEPSKKLLLMVLVPTIVLCAFAGLLLWLWKKPSRKLTRGGHSDSEDEQHNDGAELERGVIGPKRYHYRDLADATSDFAEERKLGRGGFGSVYRGLLRSDDQLPDGVPVAIKVFSSESSSQGRKEFEAEVRIISQLRHRNLVRLLGWCDSRKGLLLVYELEPEGSLDKHIYNSDRLLTWSERYKIILGLGSALSYLHQDWEQCIVHGDIKPSNIMLDTSYNTKLGDFGLARLVDHGTGPCTTNLIQGTAGYIDPEFVNTRQRSTQSDIYSFGIVLLEIVSGRQPVVNHEGVPPFMLLKWVWGLYRRNMTLDAADGRLRGGDGLYERQMERALVVGLWCAHPDLGQRPSIAQAMHVLQSEEAKLPALSLEMYIAPPLNLGVGGNGGGDNSSNFSSGVPSSATTGTTRSTGSFVN